MVHRNRNFAWQDPKVVSSGDVCINCNFMQVKPHTRILLGKRGIKFINCNMFNVDIDGEHVFEKCNTYGTHISFCSHNRPNLVKYGLHKCGIICEHSANELRVDGVIYEAKEGALI